jgi:hypothetical protein
MLLGSKEFGSALYGITVEAWCHSRLVKGGKFVLRAAMCEGRRSVSDQIILPPITKQRFSETEWDQADFRLAPGVYYVPRSTGWPVWDSCAVATVGLTGIGNAEMLVAFQMTVRGKHRLNQEHANFIGIEEGSRAEEKLPQLFQFVVPEESFPSFKIEWEEGPVRDRVHIAVMRVPISERFVKGIQE